MKFRGHGSGAMIWMALTTAGIITAAYLGRRNSQRRAKRAAEQAADATRSENFVDETLEESFPASDPPSWSPVSESRSR